MKHLLLFFCVVLFSLNGWGQTVSGQKVSVKNSIENFSFEKEFPFLDMQIYHDRQIMQEVISELYRQNNNPQLVSEGRVNTTQGIFTEKDSATLEQMMDQNKLEYNFDQELEEYLKKANEEPFKTFQEVITSVSISKLSPEDLSRLNQVDKQALPNMMQMITEAGPDIGAKPVSIDYNNET